MEENKKYLLEFLREKKHNVIEILESNFDGDYRIEVSCLKRVPDGSSPSCWYKDVEVKCMVDREIFETWLKDKNAVIWV